ncbi:putative integral membrane protein [Theileria parva strain Muguga]|uniref:Uncharacterized protein n=1 Tax=Theileria parva TaxID=5875 RepID=Q4MYW6_THEPA|nr:putative integral membrane protein [Theileria parva strain Muguga]EAN30566.1 putative integral membrane protein [Theileria parva strain Muguga]|eukprot:XP_762849.1 hypothetical protein [Theileria parva strain Muguga]
MKVTTTTANVLNSESPRQELKVDPGSLVKTYDLNEYMRSLSLLDQGRNEWIDQGGVSNLQLNPEFKDMLKEKFWRTWYHLKHVQAGPFAVYNNPTPIDVNGLFPAQAGDAVVQQNVQPQGGVSSPGGMGTEGALIAAGAMAPGQYLPNQVQMVPGVGPVAVTQQAPPLPPPTGDKNTNVDELNNSLNTKAIPTNLSVGTSPSADPNTPPLANVPVVNVIGGKTISAPGVIPSDVMERHPLFDSVNLAPNDYFRVNVENVGRSIIVVSIVLFLILVLVYRIKTRKKTKKKR